MWCKAGTGRKMKKQQLHRHQPYSNMPITWQHWWYCLQRSCHWATTPICHSIVLSYIFVILSFAMLSPLCHSIVFIVPLSFCSIPAGHAPAPPPPGPPPCCAECGAPAPVPWQRTAPSAGGGRTTHTAAADGHVGPRQGPQRGPAGLDGTWVAKLCEDCACWREAFEQRCDEKILVKRSLYNST